MKPEPDPGVLPETPCTCAMLRRTSRHVTRAYDRALRPSGLKLTQYSLLATVQRTGPITITELAERLALDRTTLTRNLRPLVTTALLTIGTGQDARSRAVRTTARGQQAYQAALPLWRKAERLFRRGLGREETDELRRLLDAAASVASVLSRK